MLLVLALFFGGTTAMMQQQSTEVVPSINPSEGMPDTYTSDSYWHKLIVDSGDLEGYAALRDAGAIIDEIDYGSFKLIIVDERQAGGRVSIQSLGPALRDEQNLVALNGYVMDTTKAEETYLSLPSELRRDDMNEALRQGRAPRGGLYIVQFVGPIKPEWLADLEATGAQVVSYAASNSYIVRANKKAASEIAALPSRNRFVQFIGDYDPAFRLSPVLRDLRNRTGDPVEVIVQVVDSPEADETVNELTAMADEFISAHQVLSYHNVRIRVNPARLNRMARLDDVFGIEPAGKLRKLDEAQGQIVSGNLSGNLPSGPGYLAWLAGRGFTSAQFGSFVVNVVDDSFSLSGHPDLPAGRIAFQNNPTSQSGAQGGHGFLNAHIIGGFNSGTGTAVEDVLGFNYGLGIAPFARVGVTAIFGGGASSPTAWENTAYGQGARISSNSWGFQNAVGGPVADYDANSQEYDRIVRDAQTGTAGHQQMTVVFAAGNDGAGSNTVSTPATAKNVICVGAGENVRQTGTDGCGVGNTGADSANDIIGFSSRGPVNSAGGDGRIKPDIMAPGTHIEAGIPQSNYNGSSVCNQFWPAGQTLYGWSSGTSHSCPAVAGGAALVYQDFINKGFAVPSPAMVKAYLMNSTARMTGVGANDTLPSNNQGMGRMDLSRAFDSTARISVDQSQVLGTSGQTHVVSGSVATTSQPFRVTVAWTDAPGPTTGAPWVNNLDLEVTVGGATYRGNVFSGGNSITGGTADTRNNVESVWVPAGVSGNFTVTVRATNIAGDGVPGNADTTDQDFALVVYNATSGGTPTPTIGVSPSSLSFSATVGGANPANQSLNISNTGGGTLNWTASDNATWLTISPTSGTAPSTVTASVNISGLAAGTYNGTITVSATGATNSPVNVPVTLIVSPVVSNLIVNGGFEGSVSPWVLAGSSFWTNTGAFPRTGTGYIFLGNANSTSGTAYQTVTIPAGSSPSLIFHLNVTSSETTTVTQFDRLFVEVRSTTGTLLSTLATFSNLNKGTAGVYVLRGPFGLSAWAGQTVRIQFRATTDVSLITTFRIDDVSTQ